MDTMFLEWTLTSMCIYGLPAILFAFVFYNMKLPFSIGAMLAPAIGNERAKKLMPVVDVICLFALCTVWRHLWGRAYFCSAEELRITAVVCCSRGWFCGLSVQR